MAAILSLTNTCILKYTLQVDTNCNRRNAPINLVTKAFYGQVLRFLVFPLPASFPLTDGDDSTHLILPAVAVLKLEARNTLNMPYYRDQDQPHGGYVEIIYVSRISNVVGRVRDRGKWAIVESRGAVSNLQLFRKTLGIAFSGDV